MTLHVTDRHQRLAGVTIIELIGFLLLVVQIHNVWDDVTNRGESIYTAMLEFAFPGTLTILFMLGALWLWRNKVDGNHVLRISQWSGGAILGALFLLAWTLGIQLFVSNGTEVYVLVANSTLIAAVGGAGVGVYSVQQSRQKTKLEESEERYRSLTEDVLDSSDVALFILDADHTVVWLNEASERYFGIDRDQVIGTDMRQFTIDTLQHRFADPDKFRTRVLEMYDTADTDQFECHVLPDDSYEERWLEHRSQPIESGLYEGGRIEHYSDITEQVRTTDVLEQRETLLRELHDVFLDPDRSYEDEVSELLEMGRSAIGVDHAFLSKFTAGAYEIETTAGPDDRFDTGRPFVSGDRFDPGETYCELVQTTESTLQFERIGENHPELSNREWYTEHGIEYYMGIPVFVQNEFYGTLCFLDTDGRTGDGWEVTLFRIMANWVGYELEQERRQRERERELRETREEFSSLVDQVEDYAIFRLDTEGYVASWHRGAKHTTGYDESDILDTHFSTFYTDEAIADGRPQDVLAKATEQDRVETEGWHVRKNGDEFWASTVVTALRDDDGDLRGFMMIVRDMTERKLREQELEHEHRRLEFINRLIRHNLLNNLNVVMARMDLIDGNIQDEAAAEHMDTIQARIEEMTDLIETMRTFMRVIVDHEDHELEPIALDSVLRNEVLKAETDYEDAVFELDDLPSVQVVADTLLPELFVNLLSNAVEHNDKQPPRVEVGVETTDDTAIVRIADNGPGVPDHIKEHVFEKGQKRYNSPGTGFGLYLVKELVDAYDGQIEIADNDPDGAIFTVELPRPRMATDEPHDAADVADTRM